MGPKNILFVAISLGEGGTEKVITDIITHLDSKKYEISLALFEQKGHYLPLIPDYVRIYNLKKKSRYGFFKLIFLSSGLFKKVKPDVVISFLAYANVVVLIAKLLSGCKFTLIINERTYLSYATLHQRLSRIKYLLYRFLFNRADFIVVPSVDMKKDLLKEFNTSQDKIRIIYNPVDLDKIKKLKKEEIEDSRIKACQSYIVAVGRLEGVKGYTYLLEAYSRIYKKIDEKLVILGTGEDEEKLRSLASKLGIRDHVVFMGFQKNPYKFMNRASIFVLSSLLEGFPNVILEAMACGVPVISTDCLSGPREIITSGQSGILVPPANAEALSKAMLSLLRDENLQEKFSKEGEKRVEDFRIDKILPQFEELFQARPL